MDLEEVSSIIIFFIALLASLILSVTYGWATSRSWDVPWSWQTMVGVFVPTEFGVFVLLRFWQPQTDFTIALMMLIFEYGFPLTMIYCLRSFYEPLPPDLFYWGVSNPFGLQEGWLLWAAIGFVVVLAAGTAILWTRDYLCRLLMRLNHSLMMHMMYGGAKSPRRRGSVLKKRNRNHSRRSSQRHRHVDQVVASIFRGFEQILQIICFQIGSFTLTPVVEEYSYRAFLMASLSSWLATPIAVVISSVVFALGHRSLRQLPHHFVGGLTFGLIYAQTRNLATPIAMHAMWNFGVAWGLLRRSFNSISFWVNLCKNSQSHDRGGNASSLGYCTIVRNIYPLYEGIIQSRDRALASS